MAISKELNELLQQMMETEQGGVQIYKTALTCVQNPDLKKEWEEYLEQTIHHRAVMKDLFLKLGIEDEMTPGRQVVKHIGESLVKAMELARAGAPEGAELAACEAVTLAETKDHQNWHLLGMYVEKAKGEEKKALKEAVDEVEDEEDEHLYHSKGWGRELWVQFLGMKAVLPPPEEEKHVKSAIGAARAEAQRKSMM